MKNKQLTKIVLIIISVIVQIDIIRSLQIRQYDYTFNIPAIKVKNLSSSDNNKRLQGQLLKQYLIKQPKQIGDVYKIQIISKNDSSIVQELRDNKIEYLEQANDLKGVWFESYTWPIRKEQLTYYLPQPNHTIYDDNLQIQIISATLTSNIVSNSTQLISTINLPIYTLLSNGIIQILQNDRLQIKVSKQYSYIQQEKRLQNQTQLYDWSIGFIFHKNGILYMWIKQSIYMVTLTQVNEGAKISRFYTLKEIEKVNKIKQVIQDYKDLYVITDEGVYIINQKNQPAVIIKFDQVYEAFKIKQKSFNDIAIVNRTVYILHSQLGVIKCILMQNQQIKYTLFRIQHPQLSSQIYIHSSTILVTYQIDNQFYIMEYQFVSQNNEFYANKIYTHHSQQQVKNILIFNNYFIINRASQIIIGAHSLSRNLPNYFHKKSQNIQSTSILDQLYQIRSFKTSLQQTPDYILVGKKSLRLVRFQMNPQYQLQQKWIKIGSEKKGVFQFDIKYTGTCKLNQFYPSQYCSITNSIQLVVNDTVGQTINLWWIWVLVSIVGIVFILVIFVFCCKYFNKKQNQYQQQLQRRKSRKSMSSVVQMSMTTAQKQMEQKTQTEQ